MIMEAVAGRIDSVFAERATHIKLVEGVLKQSDDFHQVMSGLQAQIEPIKQQLAANPATKGNL